MRSYEEIKREIKELIIETFKLEISVEDIADDEPIFGEGINLNSIQGIELIVNLEIMYGIEFDDESLLLEVFPNIKVLSQYILKKISENETV